MVKITLEQNPGGSGKVKGYKKGGKVKKTGLALVHKGEKVLTKKQAKKMKGRKLPRVTPKEE